MTTRHHLSGVTELRAAFRAFERSVFRLECLQVYRGSGEDDGIAAFLRGDPAPPSDPAEDAWAAQLRANRDAGRIQQRVHVVIEPIGVTDYLAYELTWEYGPHAAAGEDIRIIPVTDEWPRDVPRADFTLFDSKVLFRLCYDRAGTWLGAEQVNDRAAVAAACSTRDAALRQAIRWDEYMARHPELLRRLPKDP